MRTGGDAPPVPVAHRPKSDTPPPPGTLRTKLCRHHAQGRCSWGNSCRFSHEPQHPSSSRPRHHTSHSSSHPDALGDRAERWAPPQSSAAPPLRHVSPLAAPPSADLYGPDVPPPPPERSRGGDFHAVPTGPLPAGNAPTEYPTSSSAAHHHTAPVASRHHQLMAAPDNNTHAEPPISNPQNSPQANPGVSPDLVRLAQLVVMQQLQQLQQGHAPTSGDSVRHTPNQGGGSVNAPSPVASHGTVPSPTMALPHPQVTPPGFGQPPPAYHQVHQHQLHQPSRTPAAFGTPDTAVHARPSQSRGSTPGMISSSTPHVASGGAAQLYNDRVGAAPAALVEVIPEPLGGMPTTPSGSGVGGPPPPMPQAGSTPNQAGASTTSLGSRSGRFAHNPYMASPLAPRTSPSAVGSGSSAFALGPDGDIPELTELPRPMAATKKLRTGETAASTQLQPAVAAAAVGSN